MAELMISINDYPELKKLYDDAVTNKQEIFKFKGQDMLTAYCKYVLQYFDLMRNRK